MVKKVENDWPEKVVKEVQTVQTVQGVQGVQGASFGNRGVDYGAQSSSEI